MFSLQDYASCAASADFCGNANPWPFYAISLTLLALGLLLLVATVRPRRSAWWVFLLTAVVLTVGIGAAMLSAGGLPRLSPTESFPIDSADALHVANGTTIAISIELNGAIVATVEANTERDIAIAQLPPAPWTVDAISPAGRALATLSVPTLTGVSNRSGYGQRADLSCGRLDLWIGPPLLGPTFIAGASGDCDAPSSAIPNPTPTPTPRFVTPGPTPWPSNACGGFHLKVVNEDSDEVTVTINGTYSETVAGGASDTIVEWLPPFPKPLMPWTVVVTRTADGTQIGSVYLAGPVDQKVIVSGGQLEYGPYDIRGDC